MCLPVGFLLLLYSICALLTPYLFFVSFLYLDLYVLGDDAKLRGLSCKHKIYLS